MNWIRVRELVRKEFIQLFRDKTTRSILIIAPLVQLLIFGYVVTTDVRDIRVGLLDQSRTLESRMLIDAFSANKTFRITHYTDDPKDLEQILLKKKIDPKNTVRNNIKVEGVKWPVAARKIMKTAGPRGDYRRRPMLSNHHHAIRTCSKRY